ncbi:hypothetical protein WJX82_009708 [Trebouxia sp. C0006]
MKQTEQNGASVLYGHPVQSLEAGKLTAHIQVAVSRPDFLNRLLSPVPSSECLHWRVHNLKAPGLKLGLTKS